MQAADQNPGGPLVSYSVGPGLVPTLDSETYPYNQATQSHEVDN